MNFWSKIFKKRYKLSEEDKKWNIFLAEIHKDDFNIDTLETGKRMLALCVYYDNEMCNGGHSSYFDTCSRIKNGELYEALKFIGGVEFADNFWEACKSGKKDDYVKNDEKYFLFDPDLNYFIQEYFENHIDEF